MKKFFISIFILVIFFAVVFYLGWTQFKVKPGQVGIVVSKTDGVDENPVLNGQYSWYWQFLLPSNANLKCFELNPLSCEKTVKGSLPSGQIYTSMFTNADSFDYNFTFSITLSVSPENLVSLYREKKITNQEDLELYLSGAADTLAQLASNFYLQKLQTNPSFVLESVRREDILRNVKLYQDCPEVDLLSFALKESKVPDYMLYRKLQGSYINNQGSVFEESSSLENEETAGNLTKNNADNYEND